VLAARRPDAYVTNGEKLQALDDDRINGSDERTSVDESVAGASPVEAGRRRDERTKVVFAGVEFDLDPRTALNKRGCVPMDPKSGAFVRDRLLRRSVGDADVGLKIDRLFARDTSHHEWAATVGLSAFVICLISRGPVTEDVVAEDDDVLALVLQQPLLFSLVRSPLLVEARHECHLAILPRTLPDFYHLFKRSMRKGISQSEKRARKA
jgi:hypothetical protein